MRRLRWLLAVAVLLGWSLAVAAPPAEAGCHSFTVAASPDRVREGATVTVTVRRDNAINPSQVDVSSVDETARGGQDYPTVRQTIAFTGTDTQRTFTVATTDDRVSEQGETFRLHLSNPGGCAVNPNFVIGPDARVTIDDNDAAATTTTAKATTSSAAVASSTASTTTEPDGETTVTEASLDTTEPPTTEATGARPEPDGDDDGGGNALAVGLVGVALLALVGAGGYFLYRRRSVTS